MFRTLKATEIECRVAQIQEKWLSLLLYKDARCDMNILDEEVGAFNWQRHHTRDNANCIVSIKNDQGEWISKEDTGAESFTEKEKGLASDSFKRACFNWGIGRELYTAPSIFIRPKNDKEFYEVKGRYKTKSRFKVSKIEYEDKVISHLIITDQDGTVRFKSGVPHEEQEENGNNNQPQTNEKMVELGIKKGLASVLKSLQKEENVEYKPLVQKAMCEKYNVDKWGDIRFADYKKFIEEVQTELQKQKDMKEVGI